MLPTSSCDFDSVHDSALMLLETACDLVAVAKDFKADASEAEQAFKDFYWHLYAYWDGWADRKQALEFWIASNQNQSSPTALQQVLEFAQQVKHALAPDPGYLPGHGPGHLSLGPSGPGRKQIERFRENWPVISENLRGVEILDRANLGRKLGQELVGSKALVRLPDDAVAIALVTRRQQAQPLTDRMSNPMINNYGGKVTIQLNQTNNNVGDVNNAMSDKGSVVQTVGDQNKVKVTQTEGSFWDLLWEKVKACWEWIVG